MQDPESEIPLLDPKRTITHFNPKTKLIEVIDLFTGDIIAIQKTAQDILLGQKSGKMTLVATPDGKEVWIEQGLSLDRVYKPKDWTYSEVLCDLIAERVLMGDTWKIICSTPGFPPYGVLAKWKRDHADFAKKLEQAKKDRAEMHYSEVFRIAKNSKEYTNKSDRLKIDAHKWGAAVDDPDQFGTKAKISADVNATVGFTVDTGIRRPGDPGYNVDETAKLRVVETAVTEIIASQIETQDNSPSADLEDEYDV